MSEKMKPLGELDKCKDGSFMHYCIIDRRESDEYPYLFNQHGDESLTAHLYAYAIIPREKYESLQAQLTKSRAREKELVEALRYYREDCSGYEPSISVFERMVDELLAKHKGESAEVPEPPGK